MSSTTTVSAASETLCAEGEEAGFDRLTAILGTRYAGVECTPTESHWITTAIDGPSVIIDREDGGFGWQAACDGVVLAVGHTPGITAMLAAVEIAYQWLTGVAPTEAA